ncbi:MAG: hypothetical protein ACQER9_03235 [Nanobdellota archaeon]
MKNRSIIAIPNGIYKNKNELETSKSYMEEIVYRLNQQINFISCFDDSSDLIISSREIKGRPLEKHICDERPFIGIGNNNVEGFISIYRLCPEFSSNIKIPDGALLPYLEILSISFEGLQENYEKTKSIEQIIKIYHEAKWKVSETQKIQEDRKIKKQQDKEMDIISYDKILEIAKKHLKFQSEKLPYKEN